LYIHHILTAATTKHQTPWISNCEAPKSPAFSITSFGGTGFVGTGEDSSEGMIMYTNTNGTQDTGFHVRQTDTFFATAQLVNYNKESKDIYLTYDLEWVPDIVGKDMKGVLLAVGRFHSQLCSTILPSSRSGEMGLYFDLLAKCVQRLTVFLEQCASPPRIKLSKDGPTNTTTGHFSIMEDGTILGARGHLHDGGVAMDMCKFCSNEVLFKDTNKKISHQR